jgi:hypothetical protein
MAPPDPAEEAEVIPPLPEPPVPLPFIEPPAPDVSLFEPQPAQTSVASRPIETIFESETICILVTMPVLHTNRRGAPNGIRVRCRQDHPRRLSSPTGKPNSSAALWIAFAFVRFRPEDDNAQELRAVSAMTGSVATLVFPLGHTVAA